VRYNGQLRIVLSGGRNIDVLGYGRSLIGTFTGGIRAKRVRDGITAGMARDSGGQLVRPVAAQIWIAWKTALVIWAALTVLALIG
jgi:hypothetical protein